MPSSVRWIMVVSLLSAACSGGGSAALDGIFELESYTTNSADCASEGPPAYEATRYSHFFVREDYFFGEHLVSAVMCEDLATCRADAAETDTLYLGNFTFSERDDGGNWTASRGFLLESNDCAGTIHEAVLTGEPGVSVRIEEEARTVTSAPLDAEGDCDFDAARAQVADQPCEALTVVTGAFLEDI